MREPVGIEGRLLDLPLPGPAAGLRARVLEEAGRVPTARLTLTDRLWFSPGLRLSWAVTAILIVALEIAARTAGPVRPSTPADLRRTRDRGRLVALALEAGLDPRSAAAFAARSIAEKEGDDPRKEIELRARRLPEVTG